MFQSKDTKWFNSFFFFLKDSHICHLLETQFRSKDTHRLKMKGWTKLFCANANKKKVG